MDRDPRVDPQHGDFVQVRDDGREVHDAIPETSRDDGKVSFRSSLDGVFQTWTLERWREWARDSRVFHAKVSR